MIVLDHVARVVADLEAAIREYRAPVGPIQEFEAENTRDAYVETAPVRVLLMQPRSNAGPLAKRGPGWHHLGFVLDDVEAVLARLTRWRILRRPGPGPAWVLGAGILVELQPGTPERLPGDSFRAAILGHPDLAEAQRLLAEIGVGAGHPIVVRRGGQGILGVELA